MNRTFLRACFAGALLASSTIALAQAEPARIIDEGMNRSQVMITASELMDGVLLAAANSDKELPRPPLPTQPLPTDPFAYQYPDKL